MVQKLLLQKQKVHGFRPLTGMVNKIKKRYPLEMLFSPPYGDGNIDDKFGTPRWLFSPPYGDGTICLLLEQQKGWFSPPYGDGTFPVMDNCYLD